MGMFIPRSEQSPNLNNLAGFLIPGNSKSCVSDFSKFNNKMVLVLKIC